VSLWLVYTQPLHEPTVLLWSEDSGFAFFPGPLKATGLQTFVQQDKSVALPVQCLNSVSAPAAAQKQGIGKGIQIEFLLDQYSESVYPTAQICITAGNIYPVGLGKIC